MRKIIKFKFYFFHEETFLNIELGLSTGSLSFATSGKP